jgi:hypothetical protein
MSEAIRIERPNGTALWRSAQALGLVLTGALLVGLVTRPDDALALLWNVVIPIVPASLLVSPLIWRNVCPLATLNIWSSGRAGERRQTPRIAAYSGALGILLFYLMVPARRFLFNTDGVALAVTIVVVAILALGIGAAFDLKAGFCNAICPVLPVERLYGQSPLLGVPNQRCAVCSMCSKACIDISPDKSIAQHLGASRHSLSWLRSPFGAFAAALPGFVLGYFTVEDVPLAGAVGVYVHVIGWAAVSYLLALAAASLLPVRNRQVLRSLAALAAGLYYWFAAPGIAETVGFTMAAEPLRVAALAFVVAWWWKAELGRRSGSALARG